MTLVSTWFGVVTAPNRTGRLPWLQLRDNVAAWGRGSLIG